MPERFIDNGDGTITDTIKGLMWQKTDDGEQRTWRKAINYSKKLSLAGFTDWRLPTINELFSIVDYTRIGPAIDPIFSCHSDYYWSSSTYTYGRHSAWGVYFYNGYIGTDYKYYGHVYVRCVRSLGKEE